MHLDRSYLNCYKPKISKTDRREKKSIMQRKTKLTITVAVSSKNTETLKK